MIQDQDKLRSIWRRLLADSYGSESLKVLKQAGIDLHAGTWPERIVLIPFLPVRRARTRALATPRSTRVVLRFLRELAQSLEEPYCAVEAYDRKTGIIHMNPSITREMPPARILEASNLLEKMLSRRWVRAQHNPQQIAIAELRWEVKNRTGLPYDTALVDLLSAAFRAAGREPSFRLEYSTLKKVLRNEENTRKAARRKLPISQHR
jgi:hypothetical protein